MQTVRHNADSAGGTMQTVRHNADSAVQDLAACIFREQTDVTGFEGNGDWK